MKKKLFAGLTIVFFIFCISGVVVASSVQWKIENGGNGHFYERFDNKTKWHDAKAYGESLGGYLATITSQQENDFITTNLLPNPPSKNGFFLGGTDEKSEGVWQWITGETWSYTNFYPGEPNNSGNEDYLVIDVWGPYLGKWNDWWDGESHFIIEWDADPSGAVPEPTSILLLCFGLAGLMGIRRKIVIVK